MRKFGLGLVVLALAVGYGIPAQAGGNSAETVGLFVGWYPTTPGNSEIKDDPPVEVGQVVFKPTIGGKMGVTIVLEDGAPNTTFQVFVVHQVTWGTVAEQGYRMKTNGHGKAKLQFKRDIPDDAEDPVFIKAIVRTGRDGIVYVTDRHYIDLRKKKKDS